MHSYDKIVPFGFSFLSSFYYFSQPYLTNENPDNYRKITTILHFSWCCAFSNLDTWLATTLLAMAAKLIWISPAFTWWHFFPSDLVPHWWQCESIHNSNITTQLWSFCLFNYTKKYIAVFSQFFMLVNMHIILNYFCKPVYFVAHVHSYIVLLQMQ